MVTLIDKNKAQSIEIVVKARAPVYISFAIICTKQTGRHEDDFAARVAKARKLSNEAIVAAVLAMDEAALDEGRAAILHCHLLFHVDSPYQREWDEEE